MNMIKASFIAMFMVLLSPLIILFSIILFAWSCATAVVAWLIDIL